MIRAKDRTFSGQVGVFNHDIQTSSYKIFWLDGDDFRSGWCKGSVDVGREISRGDKVCLSGYWKEDKRYPAFGEQFFFSSYQVLSEPDFQLEHLGDESPQETVSGCIARVANREGTARIFFLDTLNGERIHSVGRLIPGKEILGGDYLKIKGKWQNNLDGSENGKAFFYTEYEKISKDTAELNSIRGTETPLLKTIVPKQKHISLLSQYLQDIGKEEVYYEFHNPTVNTIAKHAKKQLYERVKESSPQGKDFFFLTAFLDRNVRDHNIQDFRNIHPDFKEKLIQCWNEAPEVLSIATISIEKALKDQDLLKRAENKSKTFSYLRNALPGRSRDNQLLICLKIINEQYKRQNDINCLDFFKTIRQERVIRNYLLRIHGVGPKLASWSISNATGHWFVIDLHIEAVITKFLGNTLLDDINIAAKNADMIFQNWFGMLDEERKCYAEFTQDDFADVFPIFEKNDCEYLPYILTQYLWFYGMNSGC